MRTFGLLLLSATCSFASPIYSIAVIQSPIGWSNVDLSGINDSGQVVGWGYNGTNDQVFIATASGSIAVPLVSGWIGAAGDSINDSGQVTGFGLSSQAFVGTSSGSAAIPLPVGWSFSFGYAISDSGQVTGALQNANNTAQAFIGTASGVTTIPLANGLSSAQSFAINNSGQVTGATYNGTISPTNRQAFIGTTSGSTTIPLLSGWTSSVGTAINDSGQVAGYGFNGTRNQAFIGTASGMSPIPLPSGATFSSNVFQGSLNGSAEVVGYSDSGWWNWDASDGTQLLNAFVPAGWDITFVSGISNNGLILAQASFDGGPLENVELAPESPEPASGLLAGAGLLLLVYARRRGKLGCR